MPNHGIFIEENPFFQVMPIGGFDGRPIFEFEFEFDPIHAIEIYKMRDL
jgi:hypothetical protein